MPNEILPVERAKLMRAAGDLIGSEQLAVELGIAPRTVYALMNGTRRVKDGILTDTRKILIGQRQKIGGLVALIRHAEANAEIDGGDHEN